jgi:hypothetical protein
MAGVVGFAAVPVVARSLIARVFSTAPAHLLSFDPVADPPPIPLGAPEYDARNAARNLVVAANRATETAHQAANAERANATNIDTATLATAKEIIALFNDDGVTFLCGLFEVALDAALSSAAMRQQAYGQARISLLQKLAVHRAVCDDARAAADTAAAAADAAREVEAAAAAKVEDEKQKLAAIRSILHVLPASPPSEVYAALMAATPVNLEVMVCLSPGGQAWCTANAGTHDFLEHAAAILAERLGLPARSRGATGSSTGRGGDGGSSGEHDTSTKAGTIDLTACVEGRQAGTQKNVSASAGVLVSANLAPFKPGPVSLSQLLRPALLMFAMDKQPLQPLNGVRFAMNEGLREHVATDLDTGLAA